jgi:hypothetical protein
VECSFLVVWCCMGHASQGERAVGELEGTIGTLYCFENMEVGSIVFNIGYLESGTQGTLKM